MCFRRDYSHLWQPPPPGRWPWGYLLLLVGILLSALLLAVGD